MITLYEIIESAKDGNKPSHRGRGAEPAPPPRNGRKEVCAEMNHTPGPWESVIGTRKDGMGEEILVTTAGQQRIVAKVSPADKMDEQDVPNARLIAAAPELVEACLVAVVYLDELMQDLSGDVWWENHLRTQLRAALAKAGAK